MINAAVIIARLLHFYSTDRPPIKLMYTAGAVVVY